MLPDECVPRQRAREIEGHEVRSVHEMRWTGIRNGKLLALAGTLFDAFVTVDRNPQFQLRPGTLPLMVLVMHAAGNDLACLKPAIPGLPVALRKHKPGVLVSIEAP